MSSPPPLSTLITSLCEKSTSVKRDICGFMAKANFEDFTVTDIKNQSKLTKQFLAKSIVNITKIIDDINSSINPVLQSETLSETLDNICNTNYKQSQSDIELQLAASTQIIESMNTAMKTHSESVERQLSELKDTVARLSVNPSPCPLSSSEGYCNTAATPDTTTSTSITVSHDIKPIKDEFDNFISTDTRNELLDFLSKENFDGEGGHGVATYGEKYNYMGHKTQPKPIPECIKSVMDKLNKENTEGKYELNACLVNQYEGPESSLSEHSDDEYSINPDSDIFTISLGSPRNITFKEIFTGEETVHTAKPDSLYVMSRQSQNVFRHRIDADSDCTELRYSLTFRSVHWRFLNSTCVIGDSNTKGIKFGTGKGTVGHSTPGKQVYSPKINMINPLDCASYSNVVIAVGVNDLKFNNVKNINDVRSIYCNYRSKIMEIKRINNRCMIFILPVLPTKLMSINRKVMDFNNLIISDLPCACDSVTIIGGVTQFLDRFSGLLSESLSGSRGDTLHINGSGVALMVRLIKTTIFQKKRPGMVHSNRTYSSAVSDHPHDPH